MVDEEEDLAENFPGEMIPEIVVDSSESRDLSYLHITVPRIDSIFEKNKKVLLSESYFSSFVSLSNDFHDPPHPLPSQWPMASKMSNANPPFFDCLPPLIASPSHPLFPCPNM